MVQRHFVEWLLEQVNDHVARRVYTREMKHTLVTGETNNSSEAR